MDKHREAYKEEAHELLAELEASLLELEEVPDDVDLIGRVFRAMHTIKGSGAMFGFDDIATFTHEVETVFDMVRDGKVPVTKSLVDLSLSACDQIRKMVDGQATDESMGKEIVASFKKMLTISGVYAESLPSSSSNKKQATSNQQRVTSNQQQVNITYRIRFCPDPGIFATGTNPLLLLNELRDLGKCNVIAQTKDIPPIKDLNPEACYLYWDVILTTQEGINAIRDVFIFVEDECELEIEAIDEAGGPGDEADYKRLGEIMIERGDLSPDDLNHVLDRQKRIGKMLIENGVVDQDAVRSALVEQENVKGIRKRRQEKAALSSIRVAADKLDTLVDLVGELVTVQASLSQKASLKNDPELLSIAEEVEHLTGELRDNTMSIRMLPIGTTFSKFKRLVRDLSRELNKEVVMTTEGGETELDKTVIERLDDPLVHIIRNSIDHGIETPEIREASGKPRYGTIHLSATHSGANVLIKISDDGAGLDVKAIRARVEEKGLIVTDAEMSENEIFAQIFTPGFSTMKKVTDTSGRGVGMDVVKRSIDDLRGSVEISSKKGVGTTITLKLPLTLAIIDGLLVEIGQGYFVLPLSTVEECVELSREDVAKANGRHIATVHSEIVPYIPLRDLFMVEEDTPDIQQIVIVEVDSSKTGFMVDHVIGEHQTVIKTLGRVYKDVEGISGATILGDGTVALILDIPSLVKSAEREEVMHK